jgi:BASS family bile acid:Na+ symporter
MNRISQGFALWLALGVGWAWVHPAAFTWFLPHIPAGLGLIMLGMGLTLHYRDFAAALRQPAIVAAGVVAQFLIMPLLGWGIARVLGLPPAVAAGLILVASCPGGTASNVITHLAGGNVPLSVLMTTVSTFAAVLITPLWTAALAGAQVPVPAGAMMLDLAQVVLLPVAAGLLLNRLIPPSWRGFVTAASPLLSILFIILIVGAIVASRKSAIAGAAGTLLLAVTLLHAGGFGLGWLFARLLRSDPRAARAISVEVGMQNSGLGAKLAQTHFTDPMTAVPSALSAVCHSLIGSALAAWWQRRDRLSGEGGAGCEGAPPRR